MRNNYLGINAANSGMSYEDFLKFLVEEGVYEEQHQGSVFDREWSDLKTDWFGDHKRQPLDLKYGGQLPKAQFGKGLRWLMSPFSKRARAAHYKDLLKTKPTNFDVRGMNEASINFDPTKTFVPELNLSGANLGNLTNFEKFQLNKQLSTAVDDPEFSYLLQNYGLLNTPEYATRLGDFAANNPDSRIGLNIGNSLRIPKGSIRLNDGTYLGQNLSFPGVSGTYNESIANEMYENQVAEVLNKGIVPNNMMQTFQGKTTHKFDPDHYGTEFYVKPGWSYPSFKGNKGGLVYAGKTEEEVRRNLLDNYFEYRKPEYNKSLLTSITNNPNLVDISDKQSLLDANRNLTDAQRSWDYLSSEKTKNLESYGGTGLLFQNIGGKDFMVNEGLMNPDPLSNITRYVNRSRDFTGPQHNYMLFQGRPDLILSGDKGYVGPSGDREYTTGLPNPQANTEVPIQNEPMYNYLTQQFELNKPIDGTTFIRYKDGGSLAKAQDGKEQKWTDEQLYKWLELQEGVMNKSGILLDDESTWPGAKYSVASGFYNTLYDWLPDMSTQKGRSEAYNLHRTAVEKYKDIIDENDLNLLRNIYWGPDPSGGDKAYPYINESVSEKEERTGDFKNANDALAFAKKYNLNPLTLSVEGKPLQDITQYNSGDPKSTDISNILYDANIGSTIDKLYKEWETAQKNSGVDNFPHFERWIKEGGKMDDYVPDRQMVTADNYEDAIMYSGNPYFEGHKGGYGGGAIGANTGNEYITLDGEQVKNPMFVDYGKNPEMNSLMGGIPLAVAGAGALRAGFAGLGALMRVPIPGTAGALNLGNVANTGFAGNAMINTFPEAYRDYKKEDYGSMAENLGWGAVEMSGIGNTGLSIIPKTLKEWRTINKTLPAFNPYGETAFMNAMNMKYPLPPTFNVNPFSKSPSQWSIMKDFALKDFSKYNLNPAYAAPKLKKYGGSLPKAQWGGKLGSITKGWNALKNIFRKPPSPPGRGITHNIFGNRISQLPQNLLVKPLSWNDKPYKTFSDWQRYIQASQPINPDFQLSSLLSGDILSLTNDKNLINTNSLSSYINKTKGLNSTQLYDRQKMKTVFDDLNLGNEKFVDKDLFIGEVNKTINPQLIIPSIKSLPMPSDTRMQDYWTGSDSPFQIFSTSQSAGERDAAQNLRDKMQPHVLQTLIPNTPTVPMYDLSVGATHFAPIENPRSSGKEGGLTLGHNRIMFDPNYPKTTVSVEKQSDYAQRYNVKSGGRNVGEGAFDEYLRVLKEPQVPPTTEVRDNIINLRGSINNVDGIKKILQEEALGHWTSRSLHEQVKDFWNGATKGELSELDLVLTGTGTSFNDLTQNELLEIIQTPQFKVHMDNKVKHFKQQYINDVAKHKNQILINEKELYNIENPSELSLKLKDYKKNAPVILLSELIDYSTKLGNTHVHLPLAETVAKTQGYDANKWGSPNPLYHEYKWTGHNWNEFNDEIKNAFSSNREVHHVGPFVFDKEPSGKMIVHYTNPVTNKVSRLKGDNYGGQPQPSWGSTNGNLIREIESLRNEFLTSKGWNPEVDYKANPEAYKPEYQTILNKSTEKQIKKDIEQVFGKDYPYEIITNDLGNKYIRLDHTGPRLPIKKFHTYKFGGSVSSVYKEGYESLKDNREIIGDMMDNGAFLPKFKYGSEKQIEGILGRYNIKKEYDDTKNLPYVSYETESPGTFYDRIYYSGNDKKGNDDFSIIDISSQIREQRIEHDRTKKLITAYDNNEEISKSGLDHLRNLGMLNTKKEKEEVVPSFVYKEPVVPTPLEQIKVSSDLRNKTNKEDKGIPIESQIEFYMAHVNGLFIGTEKEEKLKKIYDKLNRIYYNDARKSNMSVIDYMKSLNN